MRVLATDHMLHIRAQSSVPMMWTNECGHGMRGRVLSTTVVRSRASLRHNYSRTLSLCAAIAASDSLRRRQWSKPRTTRPPCSASAAAREHTICNRRKVAWQRETATMDGIARPTAFGAVAPLVRTCKQDITCRAVHRQLLYDASARGFHFGMETEWLRRLHL